MEAEKSQLKGAAPYSQAILGPRLLLTWVLFLQLCVQGHEGSFQLPEATLMLRSTDTEVPTTPRPCHAATKMVRNSLFTFCTLETLHFAPPLPHPT